MQLKCAGGWARYTMNEEQRERMRHFEREIRRQVRSLRDEARRRAREANGRTHQRGHGAREQQRPRQRSRRAPTPEERAYREARLRANAKLSFAIHLVPYVCVCLFLLIVAGFRPALIVAAAWGIGVASHGFVVLAAPALRRRWIQEEVSKQIGHTVDTERQALQDRHARSLEELSASLAHEIRNPITAAKSLVQQLGEDPGSRDNVEYARVALEELDRVERSISHLLRFAREEELTIAELRVADTIDAALELIHDRFERLHVDVLRESDADSMMFGDAEKLRRVLINLINNALDALEQSGRKNPRIELCSGENLAGTEVWLRIRDNGPGFDPEQAEKLFSPFYTSKPNGTGLGLAICKKLVEAHGGTIEARSSRDDGSEFLLTFPKRPASRNFTPPQEA